MKRKINDERNRHPFYSDYAEKQWRKRLKELEQQERELGKRRKKSNGESQQEEFAEEIVKT